MYRYSVNRRGSQSGTQWSGLLPVTSVAGKRRGQNEDSIYWDESKNLWVGAVSLGFDPAGTRRRRKVPGRTNIALREH
jgi:hypothetical protein